MKYNSFYKKVIKTFHIRYIVSFESHVLNISRFLRFLEIWCAFFLNCSLFTENLEMKKQFTFPPFFIFITGNV